MRITVGVVDQGREEKLRPYIARLDAAGAAHEVLPWSGDATADVARFDAILLCGGDDVDASRWGEANHPSVTLCPPERDEYEIRIVRAARERGVPLLGVCRGEQILNVALGGSLIQHVPDVAGTVPHRGGTSHGVRIVPGTRLASIAGPEHAEAVVNSFHHQAVGRLAPGLRVSATCGDGIVEGVEAGDPSAPFLVGVQWHPEREGNPDPLGPGLFTALVQAAVARRDRLAATA